MTNATVEDAEVEKMCLYLSYVDSYGKKLNADGDRAADLIRRLAAAKASAERELVEARETIVNDNKWRPAYQSAYDGLKLRAETAEAKLREGLEGVKGALKECEAVLVPVLEINKGTQPNLTGGAAAACFELTFKLAAAIVSARSALSQLEAAGG